MLIPWVPSISNIPEVTRIVRLPTSPPIAILSMVALFWILICFIFESVPPGCKKYVGASMSTNLFASESPSRTYQLPVLFSEYTAKLNVLSKKPILPPCPESSENEPTPSRILSVDDVVPKPTSILWIREVPFGSI